VKIPVTEQMVKYSEWPVWHQQPDSYPPVKTCGMVLDCAQDLVGEQNVLMSV